MRRRARAGIVTLALALTALSSCGASGTVTTERDPATGSGPEPAAKRGTRPGAEADRQLRQPGLRRRGAGQPRAALRRRAGRQDPGAPQRAPPGQAVPRHLRPGLLRRRARPALGRLPARLRAERPLLRLLHRQRGQHPDRRVPAPLADQGRGRLAPPGDRGPPPGELEPQRRPGAVPRRPPLLRHRRRRLRRRPAQQRPEQGEPARQAAADRPPRRRRAAPTRSPPRTRSSAAPVATRSTATGCATRSASPSTRSAPRQPRIAIGDVGQSRFEEVDYTTVGRGLRRQLRLGRLRGLRALRRRERRHPRPGRHREADLRLLPRRAAAARSPAATWSPTAGSPSLYKRYVYTDYCDGTLRSLVPHLGRASGDRRLGLSVEEPGSFGDDTRGRVYVTSLAGPVYRLASR